MKYRYDKVTNTFYPHELQEQYKLAGIWPIDGIDVEPDIFAEFSGPPPDGKVRAAGEDGAPSWKSVPPPTQQELVTFADTEKQSRINQANEYMNSKQWPGKAAIGRLKGDELATYNLWLDYLDELEAVDTSAAPNIAWPTLPEV